VIEPPRLEALLAQLGLVPRHDPHDRLIRQVVRLRARDSCEYCLLPTTGQFQIDHVIPNARWQDYMDSLLSDIEPPDIGRHGPDHLDNFAWSCAFCNAAKRQRVGARIASQMIRLFDPRIDHWPDHFTFMHHYLFIVGVTPLGVATQQILGFNEGDIGGPLGNRHESILAGRYPPAWLTSS